MIDWEAAKSGKRLLRQADGAPCRYIGPLMGERHAIAVSDRYGNEYALTYRDNGLCLSADPHLVQDPEVIDFKYWANIYDCTGVLHLSKCGALECATGALATAVPIIIRITGDKVEIFGGTE